MKLCIQVRLGPGHTVLDGDQLLLPQRRTAPLLTIFGPHLLRPNGWMDKDATWYGGIGLGPGDFVLSRGSVLK